MHDSKDAITRPLTDRTALNDTEVKCQAQKLSHRSNTRRSNVHVNYQHAAATLSRQHVGLLCTNKYSTTTIRCDRFVQTALAVHAEREREKEREREFIFQVNQTTL